MERIRRVAKAVGKSPTLLTRVDAALIGGIVLRIGDTQIDGSVETQLERMKEKMKREGAGRLQGRVGDNRIRGVGSGQRAALARGYGMKFKIDEITSVIQQEISQYQNQLDVTQVGKVIEVGDGIARIYGLRGAMAGEMLEFPGHIRAGVQPGGGDGGGGHFGNYKNFKEGDMVRSTGELLSCRWGRVLGRVVIRWASRMDGGPAIQTGERRKMDIIAPGIADRQPVKEPLQTGIKAIDAMIPIGRGQRN